MAGVLKLKEEAETREKRQKPGRRSFTFSNKYIDPQSEEDPGAQWLECW